MKNKKATKNPPDKKDHKCFQYAVSLNHKEIGKILKE